MAKTFMYCCVLFFLLNAGYAIAVMFGWEPKAKNVQVAAYTGAAGYWLAMAIFNAGVKW